MLLSACFKKKKRGSSDAIHVSYVYIRLRTNVRSASVYVRVRASSEIHKRMHTCVCVFVRAHVK